jgi:hypothetical protein
MFYHTFLCSYQFVGAFAKLRKAIVGMSCLWVSLSVHVSESLCMENLGSHWMYFYEILSIYWKLLRKVRFHKDLKRITDTYFKTHIHWWYLTHFFFESEMFQTKLVEKIKMHTLCPVTIFEQFCCLWDNGEKCYHRWQHNTVHTQCMLVYEGYTHTQRICNTWCAPQQHWLCDSTSVLHLHVHYLSCFFMQL